MSKKINYQSPKGMRDVLPVDQPWWDKVRKETKEIADFYNYSRIDTPILENAALFQKSVGEATDIVEKQMFIFASKGGDKLALRPEGTASVARAYIQNGMSHLGQPLKLYYDGPMFRHEQPQAGRFRQFNQVGFEIMGGEDDPVYDIQVILAIYRLLESLKIKKLSVHINTIGCKICRPIYRRKLTAFYKSRQKELCGSCVKRLATNPLRLLDCKVPRCEEIKKDAPSILNDLCLYCQKHFKGFLEYIEDLGLPYQINPYLVRGLDYYNRTVFEIFTETQTVDGQGFDFALASGGRYDYLIEMLGGRSMPATGGAMGVERVIEVMKKMEVNVPAKSKPRVFLINIGALAKKKALVILEEFIKSGIRVGEALGKNSLDAQFKAANKEKAELALVIGQKEAFKESIIVKDMKSGAQEIIPLKKVVNEVKKRLK